MKIVYWLNVDWFRRTRRSTIDCHYRWFTIILADSRSFSLTHDAHSESEMQSSSSKRKFQTGDFLLTRVFLRVIRRFFFEHSRIFTSDENIVSTRSLYEQLAIFFNLAYLYERLTILFCLFAYLDEQLICRSRTFDRVSISLAELKAKNLLCKRQWIIVTAINREISCWKWNRHELNCAEDVIVANWSILFLSTRWSFGSECEVYIARHDENQI